MAKMEKSPRGTKTKKIKDKLLLFIVPAVVVTIIILVAISSFLSKSRLEEMARNELESSITNQADNIYAWLQQNLENFSTIKASLEGMDLDETYYEEVLTTFVGSNSNAPNGKLKPNPINEPMIAITKYFVKYKLLIFPFLIPIAFITPISLYSSVIVNVIVNFNTTKATIIKQTLRINVINATIMFMIYAVLKVPLSLASNMPGVFANCLSTAFTSSVSI